MTTAQAALPKPRRRRSWTGWQFVGPFMAVFALVFLAPIAYSIYISLFKTRLIGGTSFVGLENYQQALSDPNFWDGLGRVALFLAIQVPIMLGLALLAALAIDSGRLHGAGFFRITIFLPYAVPAVVAAIMWGFMYGNQFGLVGNINEAFGVDIPAPLGPDWILASIGNIVTWEFVGYNMLIFYSALRVIPASLYEARRSTVPASSGSSARSSCRPSGARSSSPRSSRSSAASSCSPSRRSCRSWRRTRSPRSSRRTTTRTRCRSTASSTTTRRPSRSSWAWSP